MTEQLSTVKRVDEYHKHGCHFSGKLVVVDYMVDARNDPKWGTFGAGLTYDYLAKAKQAVLDLHGEPVRVLLEVPEYVVEIK